MAEDRPGTLRMLGSNIRARFEEARARELTATAEIMAAEAAIYQFEELARKVREDDGNWIPIGADDPALRDLGEQDQRTLREQSTKASYQNAHAIGYLRTLLRFVMGAGPTFTPEEQSDALTEAMAEWWDKARKVNNWDTFEDEFAWRLWRDGEVFIRRFTQMRDGPIEGLEVSEQTRRWLGRQGVSPTLLLAEAPEIERGMVQFRFIPPHQIMDPEGKISHGIITARHDVQTVLGYIYSPDGKHAEVVPASQIMHVKIRVDSDVKRGRSQLEPILKRMKEHDQWVNYRLALNLARTAVVLIKKIEGAQSISDVQAVRNARQLQTKEGDLSRAKLQTVRPMTTIHAGPGISYDFKSANLQAGDAQHDGRMLLLSMSAATGLPEYMFTGDASNANYSSTLTAESPAVREFESWQDTLTPHFVQLYRWVMEGAAEAKAVKGLTVEIVEEMEVQTEWPPLEVRDQKAHSERNLILHDAKVLSRETWARDEGIDWEEEQERLEEDEKAAEERMGMMPGGDAMPMPPLQPGAQNGGNGAAPPAKDAKGDRATDRVGAR